jgi:hypothetical protein
MDTKDWLIPLITGAVGLVGGLGASWISGHYQENAAIRQAELELKKVAIAGEATAKKDTRDVAVKYIAASDALISAVLFSPKNEQLLAEKLTAVQVAGAELILISDEELARYTNSVSAYLAKLALNRDKSLDGALDQVATIRAQWMKQLRLSLGHAAPPAEARTPGPSANLPGAQR